MTLNPDGRSYCIDTKNPVVKLPIQLNQTDPVHIELLRLDFDTGINESIVIYHKELQTLKKQAEKRRPKGSDTLTLEYGVKKPGLYRLQSIMEKSNLEVQRRMSDTLVVLCPKAMIKPSLPLASWPSIRTNYPSIFAATKSKASSVPTSLRKVDIANSLNAMLMFLVALILSQTPKSWLVFTLFFKTLDSLQPSFL